MRDFRELKVWEKAHRLTLQVYGSTMNFPSDERFGLMVQLRRAAASVPMNIAAGSASEGEYQLLLARDLNYCSTTWSHAARSPTLPISGEDTGGASRQSHFLWRRHKIASGGDKVYGS